MAWKQTRRGMKRSMTHGKTAKYSHWFINRTSNINQQCFHHPVSLFSYFGDMILELGQSCWCLLEQDSLFHTVCVTMVLLMKEGYNHKNSTVWMCVCVSMGWHNLFQKVIKLRALLLCVLFFYLFWRHEQVCSMMLHPEGLWVKHTPHVDVKCERWL